MAFTEALGATVPPPRSSNYPAVSSQSAVGPRAWTCKSDGRAPGTLIVFPLSGPGVHEGVRSFPRVDIGLPAIVMGRRRARIQPLLGERMPALTWQCSANAFDQPCRGERMVSYVKHLNPFIVPPIRANLSAPSTTMSTEEAPHVYPLRGHMKPTSQSQPPAAWRVQRTNASFARSPLELTVTAPVTPRPELLQRINGRTA